jgi:hypothetical protein
MYWQEPLDVVEPVISQYDTWLFNKLRGGHPWSIVEVGQWQAGVRFIWGCGSRRHEEVQFFKWYHTHFGVPDDK